MLFSCIIYIAWNQTDFEDDLEWSVGTDLEEGDRVLFQATILALTAEAEENHRDHIMMTAEDFLKARDKYHGSEQYGTLHLLCRLCWKPGTPPGFYEIHLLRLLGYSTIRTNLSMQLTWYH
jgi:hypothetical protein